MVDIIREAEEDLQQEKLQLFWAKWGKAILGACVGIVLGTAAITGFGAWQTSVDEKATSKIMNIVRPDLGNTLDTSALVEIVDDLPSDQAAIARFIAIGDLMREDKLDEAASQLEAILDEGGADDLMRGLARVQLAALYVENADKTSEDIQKVLRPIFGSPKDPWYAQAKLNMALSYVHKDQDYGQAATTLKQALDRDDIPQPIRVQAQKLYDLYVIKASETKDKG